MSKKLKKKFTSFVWDLSEIQAREQLVLAYLQMERCQQALRGENVEPVEMMDNGMSSDLELFYQCKKMYQELASNADDGVSISTSINVGQDVYYFDGEIEEAHVEELIYDADSGWTITLSDGMVFNDTKGLFRTKEGLIEKMKEVVYGK